MSLKAQALLSKRTTEVERPKPLPEGTYSGIIEKREFGTTKSQDTNLKFTIGQIQPGDDVNQDALAGFDLGKKKTSTTFLVTETALFRLSDFLSKLEGGADGSRSMSELIEDAIGKEVDFMISHRMSQDGANTYEQVDNLTIKA